MRRLAARAVPVHPLGNLPGGLRLGRTAERLERLLRLGLPVPPGFVIADDARDVQSDLVLARMRELFGRLPSGAVLRPDPAGTQPPSAPALGIVTFEALVEEVRSRWRDTEDPTPLIVQARVCPDADERSGSGVVFTRDPATGSPGGYGRFAAGGAWAEDPDGSPLYTLRNLAPGAWDALEAALPVIETGLLDVCEVHFVVESGRLWILHARPAPRHPVAEVRIGVDLVDEGLIGLPQALALVRPAALSRLQAPVLSTDQPLDVVARGRSAAPGVVTGRVTLDGVHGEAGGVLVTDRPVPPGHAARGVLTGTADGLRRLAAGPPAICVSGLRVDAERAVVRLGDQQLLVAGELVTLDGGSGLVVRGEPRLVPPPLDHTLARLLDWCDARAHGRVEVAPAPGDGEAVVEIAGTAALEAAVADALAAGARGLALKLPPGLLTVDPHPPAGPWRTVVAGPESSWAARLIAARLAVAAERAG